MVTEREEKLAAARKKLARFQQTKTTGHQRQNSQQPKLESIGRGVEESNSSNEQTRNTSPDSLNGFIPDSTPNLMYSNPTPTFETIQSTPQQKASLNAVQLAELEASKIQLKEHQNEIAHLHSLLEEETKKKQQVENNNVQLQQELQSALDGNKQLVLNIEQLNATLLKIETAKNEEITEHKANLMQSEQVAIQLNAQLQMFQKQLGEYRSQVSMNETTSISNQHQLHNRIQQQDNAIHILVEEKAELISKIKALDDSELLLKHQIENKQSECKQLQESCLSMKNEVKMLKEYMDQSQYDKGDQEEKIRNTNQSLNKSRQENEILKRRDDENKFMIEQLQDQLKQTYAQMTEINEQKNMAEASLGQLSCGSEAIVLERNQLVEKLNEIEVKYEQVRNQLDEVKLERDNLQRSHTATSQKFQNAIDDMSGQILNLTDEKIRFETIIEQLKSNEITISEREDTELDELNQQLTQQAESLYELQDRVKLEIGAREQCEVKIQDMRKEKQSMENDMLKQKETIEAFQRRCHDLEEANVQTKILLESSQADKNHISRVMQQNEKLKNEFQELQLQLARVSTDNADMTIKMGTLEHSLNKSLQQIEETDGIELDKNQWRQRLEDHETAIHNLKRDLETSRLESKNLLQQNAELQQALLTAREQLKQRFQQQQLQHEQQQQQLLQQASQQQQQIELESNSIKGSVSGNSESEVSLNGEKGNNDGDLEKFSRNDSNSSSYSIVDYESDQTSASENARADSLGVDDINQTTVSVPDIPQATEVHNTEEQTDALEALKEDLDIAKNRIRDLEEERDDLTSQLVSSKQKQLNLINEVGGIKEARPEAEDYHALKTAKDALEKKFVEIIDQNASIKDENEKLEALVHQLSAETDTIIEYVSLYREQRSALARKEKERETEIKNLSKSKLEVQGRVNELELLLKSTVQNIKPSTIRKVRRKPVVERPEGTIGETDEELMEDGQKSPDRDELENGDHGVEVESVDEEEFEIIEGGLSDGDDLQQKNISKILGLLDEIRDPFAGHSAPAMIGLEYVGELHTI